MLVRFTFTYDDEFDADIHEMLQKTPQKRRSERMRNLIRVGMSASSQHTSYDRDPGDGNKVEYQKPAEDHSADPVRRAIRFGPSSHSSTQDS